MWRQIPVIAWAQTRIIRNHLPRTGVGSVLMALLTLVWYGLFCALAYALATFLASAPVAIIDRWLSRGLLGAFLFWQIVPLFTLTGGWSLDLKKLQVYPISTGKLFSIEVSLRISTAFEVLFLLTGACIGLMRNPQVALLAPLWLFAFVPFNLFCALALRETILHSFRNRRFRELFSIGLISLSTLPSFFLHTRFHSQVNHILAKSATAIGMPWQAIATLSRAHFSILPIVAVMVWTLAAYLVARRQFTKTLREEDLLQGGTSRGSDRSRRGNPVELAFGLPNRLFADPVAALVEKEIRTLLRMPRFRVVFGMACLFSVIIFIPLAFETSGTQFVKENFLLVVNIYGLLLLSDTLLWNIFGLDRAAAQIYFAAPMPLRAVFRAKNAVAIFFIAVQSAIVCLVAFLLRFPITFRSFGIAVAASLVVSVFFLAAGNLSSVSIPRPIDPTQTLRKQAGGQIQLWLAACSLSAFLLVGFAFLAGWALQNDYALFAVFAVEFAIGMIVFRIAQDAALERGARNREIILDALAKGSSQIAL